LRPRSTSAEMYTTPQPATAKSEAISSVQRLWLSGGISREGSYVAKGDFGGTLDVSTFLSSFLTFFTAFFSFFACFRSPFVFLDIRRGPPPAVMAAWTFRHTSQASVSSLRHRFRSIASRQDASAVAQHDQPTRILRYPAAIDGSGDGQVVMPIDDFLLPGAFAALFEQLDGVFAFGF